MKRRRIGRTARTHLTLLQQFRERLQRIKRRTPASRKAEWQACEAIILEMMDMVLDGHRLSQDTKAIAWVKAIGAFRRSVDEARDE